MENLQDRTKQFALEVFRFCDALPTKPSCWVISKQLMRSASSVGANYRAACRAQSRTDFIAKLSIVEEEADESLFWIEMVEALDLDYSSALHRLKDEANQLVAITVASKKTARRTKS
jgi:four helix bundle protein